MIQISPIKICKDNFKPFGDIIEYDKEKSFTINQRTTERFDSLATINVQYGHPITVSYTHLTLPTNREV